MTDEIEAKIYQILEDTSLAGDEPTKVAKLKMAQELILAHSLIDKFAENVFDFQNGHGNNVRKFVIAFFEIVARQKPVMFPGIAFRLGVLLQDTVDDIVKRTIQACTQLYKVFLVWISTVNDESCKQQQVESFKSWGTIKDSILNLLDSASHDGVRTQAVKFIETVILLQTSHDAHSNRAEFSVDQLSQNSIANIKELKEESKKLFAMLVNFQSEAHISSTNLVTVMSSLQVIGRQRSEMFFNKTCQSYNALCYNLPPTLGTNHVISVKKQLKMNLLKLVRHTFEITRDFYKMFVDMLVELEMPRSEIEREMLKKRTAIASAGDAQAGEPKLKRPKVEGGADKQSSALASKAHDVKEAVKTFVQRFSKQEALKARDLTAQDILKRLETSTIPEVTGELVRLLPADKRNISIPKYEDSSEFVEFFAYVLVSNGVGPGFTHVLDRYFKLFCSETNMMLNEELQKRMASYLKHFIAKSLYESRQKRPRVTPKEELDPVEGSGPVFQFDDHERAKQIKLAFKRIIEEKGIREAEKNGLLSRSLMDHSTSKDILTLVHRHVLQNLKERYRIYQNILVNLFMNTEDNAKSSLKPYTEFFMSLLDVNGKIESPIDQMSFYEILFHSVPHFPEEGILFLKQLIFQTSSMSLVEVLIKNIHFRLDTRQAFLAIFLELCIQTPSQVLHEQLINVIPDFYKREDCQKPIREFSLKYLKLLRQERPELGIAGVFNVAEWNDTTIKRCLTIFLVLLKNDITMIHQLPSLFTECFDDRIRKVILLSTPSCIPAVIDSGTASADLLQLIEKCPPGAEALISSMVSYLTESRMPPPELVEKMRTRFGTSPSDIRYLIPVLNGLTKADLISALPNLIKLNANVLKQVYTRLLIAHGDRTVETNLKSPITPVELLIALHNIDSSDSDVRVVIKAINLCFEQPEFFTSETFAVTMQQLVSINPMPQLLMRTVITVVKRFPQLVPFIMNGILPSLIQKKIWTQKALWDGFVRCCQATVPACFAVLAQLPVEQLTNVFEMMPDLRPQLQHYIRESQSEAGFTTRHLDIIFS